MSSSTSPTTSSALGACVVCGRESTTACSVCRKAGLDWMYFCSVDHQRLIWKTHKLGCGKNPFTFPALSENEVEEMWKVRHDRSVQELSLIQIYRTTLGSRIEAKDDLLEASFQLKLSRLKEEDPGTIVQQSFLSLFRSIAFGTKMYTVRDAKGAVTSEETRKLLVGDPLGFLAMVEQGVPPTTVKSDWWIRKFRHRLFIFIGTLQTKEENQEFADRNISWTATRIFRFARETELEVDSESARFLDEVLVPFLSSAVGLEMHSTVSMNTWIERMAKEG